MKRLVVGGGWLVARKETLLLPLILIFLMAFVPVAAQTTPGPMGTTPIKPDSTRSFSREDTTLIVKHHFNHRQQIITGSVIMACMAAIVVVMNNYNPQGLNP